MSQTTSVNVMANLPSFVTSRLRHFLNKLKDHLQLDTDNPVQLTECSLDLMVVSTLSVPSQNIGDEDFLEHATQLTPYEIVELTASKLFYSGSTFSLELKQPSDMLTKIWPQSNPHGMSLVPSMPILRTDKRPSSDILSSALAVFKGFNCELPLIHNDFFLQLSSPTQIRKFFLAAGVDLWLCEYFTREEQQRRDYNLRNMKRNYSQSQKTIHHPEGSTITLTTLDKFAPANSSTPAVSDLDKTVVDKS